MRPVASHVAKRLTAIADTPGPHLCQVMSDERQRFELRFGCRQPKDKPIVSAPLKDMAPLLDRAELARNTLADSPTTVQSA
ncbi:MAG: hypothetical protein AW09_003626 [Candidatus Accumulibacter phosphatis]|uniref:Uncharacterized protein n=1 Tax=Candidatus Accumulibacter phosphatis TaxID=327160 RepID=A0A080M269_9PROT|nr:MAG: hypothetical protein AW09_003626 [Candidatus Accumulibacter phosphatis]